MIGLLLAAALTFTAPPTAPPDIPPLRPRPTPPPAVAPVTMLARYAEALAENRTPSVLSFEYSIDQSGPHDIQQTHRVFRSGSSVRDELRSSDGKALDPPSIRIFLGDRNRYALEALAPRPEAYAFHFVGTVRDGHHVDEVFATTPRSPSDATVSQVTIDGITALPVTIRFVTRLHGGSGSITFGRVQKYWMVTAATASANSGKNLTIEHLTFSRYRFPRSLAASTFSKPKPLPSFPATPY